VEHSDDFEKKDPQEEKNPQAEENPQPDEMEDFSILDDLLTPEELETEDDFHPTPRSRRTQKGNTHKAGHEKKEPTTKAGKLWKDYGYLLVTVVVVFVLFRLIFQLAYVPTGSMETTLPTRSVLLSWRAGYLVSDPVPERGDVLTFWSDELGELLVKRVIGLPGETVTFRADGVYVDGIKLDEPYLDANQVTTSEKSFTVPDGCLFFMGDNRTGSYDARYWNQPFIPISKVQARTLLAVSIGKKNAWTGVHVIT
jgi:signal peptidase I